MSGVFVGNFGIKDGIQTYRVNGTKQDLEKILDEVKKEGARFKEEPVIEHVRKSEWSVLIQIDLTPQPQKSKEGIISKTHSYNKGMTK